MTISLKNDDHIYSYKIRHNQIHPSGYRLPAEIMALASAETREISSTFIGQRVDINGNMAQFAQRYNFVRNDSYTIGSASQDC